MEDPGSKLLPLMEKLVAALGDAATLHVREWGGGYYGPFDVKPTNPKAAAFSGFMIANDLTLKIGDRAYREFYGVREPETVVIPIWQSVVEGGFTERRWTKEGSVIIRKSELALRVDGKDMYFAYGVVYATWFSRCAQQRIEYDAY